MSERGEHPVLVGAEALSHCADGDSGGVLALHGFTGSPSSMAGVAAAMIDAGLHVEVPRLPGHGTDVADMVPTRWSDWAAEVAAAYQRLASRTERIVVVGQSMGGTLALWTALHQHGVRGLVLVNPMTESQPADVRAMLGELSPTERKWCPESAATSQSPESSRWPTRQPRWRR